MTGREGLRIVSIVVEPRTYMRIVYLLLSFPLGIAYFVFLVTGVALGVGLLIIWVGVFILALVLAGSWVLTQWERLLAIGLLGEDIPRVPGLDVVQGRDGDGSDLGLEERLFVGAWRRFKRHVSDRLTWTGILFLLLKFPLGIASFVVVIVLVSVSLSFLGAPFYYWAVDDGLDFGIWQVDELWEAVLVMLLGIPTLLASAHIMNLMGFLYGRLARVMLGRLFVT